MTDGEAETDTDILPLDRSTVERIAAGEVVERPASAVKELVENSLDAGADRVDVTVEGDGTGRIRVADDGRGMTEADVRAAVREHTTSKIRDVDDLEAGVATLGFRGEALHTIGAVSRMTITTKPGDADGAGTRLVYEGGDVVEVEPAGRPAGTTVEVEDLFYNTPARRKYLKREATEFAHVNRIVSRYALANPDVAVSLTHDDRETFATTGQGDLRAALLSVYGREVAEAMVPLAAGDPPAERLGLGTDRDGDESTDLPEGPLEGLAGYVSHPETTRSSREYVTAFVNGRYVDAGAVREAVLEAYGGQLASDRYPFVVLFLDLPAESVDVNVHPRKMEVRFGDEAGVRDQVRTAVREALLEHGLVRSAAPRGRSAPEETPVGPDSADAGAGSDAPDAGTGPDRDSTEGARSTAPGSENGPSADRGSEPGSAGSTSGSANAGAESVESGSGSAGADSGSAGTGTGSAASETRTPGAEAETPEAEPRSSGAEPGSSGAESGTPGAGSGSPEAGSGSTGTRPDPHPRRDRNGDDRDGKFGPATEQRTLGGETATPAREYDRLPRMRVLGQVDDTYVVCETPDGLALVDQHAADERVNYERLTAELSGETTTQRLATPVELELTPGEAATFEAARESLARLGFEADLVGAGSAGGGGEGASDGTDYGTNDGPDDEGGRESDAGGVDGDDGGSDGEGDATGGRILRVGAVPSVLGETVDPDRLRDLLAAFVAGGDAGATVEELAEDFLADLACYPSITGNTSLTEGSVVDLLSALDDCENPYACPHGRPVIVGIDRDEIEARFERDYPGHGGRRGS